MTSQLFRVALFLVLGVPGAAVVLGATPGRAEERRVVVELFTSQGCSSCPPADALLLELAKREDVVALALHVDYWDYIGWKDVFADRAFTLRQKGYARAGKRRSVYTPQMIIHGRDHVVGNHPMDVTDLITTYQAHSQPVALSARREGGKVVVRARAEASGATVGDGPGGEPLVVQLVRYEAEATADIRRGENAGHKITYANVVRDWQVIGEWDGTGVLTLEVGVPVDLPLAVIVQKTDFGPILAAARVE